MHASAWWQRHLGVGYARSCPHPSGTRCGLQLGPKSNAGWLAAAAAVDGGLVLVADTAAAAAAAAQIIVMSASCLHAKDLLVRLNQHESWRGTCLAMSPEAWPVRPAPGPKKP